MVKSSTKCKYCGNTLWDVNGNSASCTNCGTERLFKRRQPSEELTPSQQNSIERIKRFFEERQLQTGDLAQFEIKPVIPGTVSVVVRTQGNHITQSGASFFVRSRGAIELCQVYDLVPAEHKQSTAKHFCLMLGAKMGKH
jgi:DNA-directed RNA polymerase subunit RPC12/RpoP